MKGSLQRIALIHATPLAVTPINEAFARLWPEVNISNLLDDSLAPDLARSGKLDDPMIARFRLLSDYVVECGADAILFTCSAFGKAIESVAAAHAPMPVLSPNGAMFKEAISLTTSPSAGGRIGMVATFAPSIPSMEREFVVLTKSRGMEVELECACANGAMEALAEGDTCTHDALIVEAARNLAPCDAIMLAQFSMARALSALVSTVTSPILTSPDSAVRKLQRLQS